MAPGVGSLPDQRSVLRQLVDEESVLRYNRCDESVIDWKGLVIEDYMVFMIKLERRMKAENRWYILDDLGFAASLDLVVEETWWGRE